eukprot:3208138-Amphidinium_carterae.1
MTALAQIAFAGFLSQGQNAARSSQARALFEKEPVLRASKRPCPIDAQSSAAVLPGGIVASSIACGALTLWRRQSGTARGARIGMLAKRGPRWAPGGKAATSKTGWDPQSMVDEVLPGEGQCFKVMYERGIGLREGPDIYAKRTGRDLVYGEIFEVKTEVRRGGRRYFELMDGRGWAFDWTEVQGERVELLEMAALLYTMVFPNGVDGVEWATDYQLRFTKVKAFKPEAASALLEAGMGVDDILVMIDKEPVAGMPFSQVLNRLWATRGAQPGSGNYYRVITPGPFGIGIREDADIESQRTGEDLVR